VDLTTLQQKERKMADGVSISKWSILMLTCATAFGSYYSFETPSVLHNAMFKHYGFTNDTEFELYFSLIYSLYALPNTVIPLVGGLLADKFGNKKIMLLFASFVLLGSAIETVACFQKSMALFLFGRFIFGCGAETLNVCCSIVISKWFKGQELALALAINLSLSKLATVVTDWTSPLMYRSIGIENNAIWVTTLCLICYLLTVLLLKYDTDESNASQMQAHADRLLGNLTSRMRSTDDAEAQHLLSNSAYIGNSSDLSGARGSIELGQLPGASQPRRRNVDGSAAQDSESTAQLLANGVALPPPPPARSASQRLIKPSSSDENIQYLATPHTGQPTSTTFTFLGFGLPVWGLFCFTFVMYGTFIPFTNWSSVILIRFYFNRSSPSAAYITYREITAAR
jgi:MFS family permease